MVVKLISQTFNLDFFSLVYFSPSILTIGTLGHDNRSLKLTVYFVFYSIGKTCLEIKSLREKARELTIKGITNMSSLHFYFFLSFTCCLLKIVNVKNIEGIPNFIMFKKCHFLKKPSSLLMYVMSFISCFSVSCALIHILNGYINMNVPQKWLWWDIIYLLGSYII